MDKPDFEWQKISTTGLELVGKGGRASVYALDDEKIVKVFHDDLSEEIIKTELTRAGEIYHSGIPAAMPYRAVIADGKYGLVYERLKGRSLGAMIADEPERAEEYGIQMGKLLKQLHTTRLNSDTLPNIKNRIFVWTDYLEEHFLNPEEVRTVREIIEVIPTRDTLLHCDFHPGNIMLRGSKPVLIDLDDVCTGHPIFDLSFNSLLHKYSDETMIKRAMSLDKDTANRCRRFMLAEYFGTNETAKLNEYERLIATFDTLMILLVMARSAKAWNITMEQARLVINSSLPKFCDAADNITKAVNILPFPETIQH